jgi:aminoglycoside phosphotransferase
VTGENKVPVLIGASGSRVFRIHRADGRFAIEKQGPALEITVEAAVLNWCADRLPVPKVIEQREGVLIMSELPGVNLTDVPLQDAVNVIVVALSRIHGLPVEGGPFSADWSFRLRQAEQRLEGGLVDEADFDEENLGREPADMLAELKSLPPLPDLACFTHGDACLPNFLSQDGRLSGIVDWGRAGVTHPAQDWALALRSMRFNFGINGGRMLRERLPLACSNEDLLRRFRLLDEFF